MSNYVCVKSGETVKRIRRTEADRLVASGSWSYCPRKEWKNTFRDATREVIAENVLEALSAPRNPRNGVRKNNNFKGKARKVAQSPTKVNND